MAQQPADCGVRLQPNDAVVGVEYYIFDNNKKEFLKVSLESAPIKIQIGNQEQILLKVRTVNGEIKNYGFFLNLPQEVNEARSHKLYSIGQAGGRRRRSRSRRRRSRKSRKGRKHLTS